MTVPAREITEAEAAELADEARRWHQEIETLRGRIGEAADARARIAWDLNRAGYKPGRIAAILGVHGSVVSRLLARGRELDGT